MGIGRSVECQVVGRAVHSLDVDMSEGRVRNNDFKKREQRIDNFFNSKCTSNTTQTTSRFSIKLASSARVR